MLELSHLQKTYHPGEVTENTVFSDFSLTVERGEFVSIVGSNGSGKTTLLGLICGTIGASGGQILLDGADVTRVPAYKRAARIGRVYQNPEHGTCANLTLLENLSLADRKGGHYGLTRGVSPTRIDVYRETLAALGMGLEDKLDLRVGLLSGGQRQALALLLATMTPIDLLILDEHTAALDPKSAEVVMELTDRVVREKNLTALMVTHNLRYAVEYGSRLLMLHAGGIVLDRAGKEKASTTMDDVLTLFNTISVECGN